LPATSKTVPQLGKTAGYQIDTPTQIAVHRIPFGEEKAAIIGGISST
jgi:hypothetical protein